MKKELGIAIFIGIFLGFGLSAFFWFKNKEKISFLTTHQLTPTPTEIKEISDEISDDSAKADEIFLSINQPENEIISSQETITLSGETLTNATVVVIWEEEQEILVADKNGEFETEVNLIGGENRINVSAYDNQGNKAAQSLTVTYSTAKF